MDSERAEAIGDLMLLLHTRARGEETPLLPKAIVRFARHFAAIGASRRSTLDILQGLIDQAVAYADLASPKTLQVIDELLCRSMALCGSAYDAARAQVSAESGSGPRRDVSPGGSARAQPRSAECRHPFPAMEVESGLDDGIVVVRFAGHAPFEDAKAALRAALPGTEHAEVRGTLLDLRSSESIDSRPRHELEAFGDYFASLREEFGGRLAIVVKSDVAYGLARVAAAWAGSKGLMVQVERSATAALSWLKTPFPARES